jgi:hypothetical protein
MSLPHALKRIRLNIARSRDFPSKIWQAQRGHCRLVRFWEGEEDQIGRLVHKPGGSEHARWVFDYDRESTEDDESGYRFGAHRFLPGEYVTISDRDGAHTFRVASVESATLTVIG